LTRNEETLLAAGQHDLVRAYRLRFQEAMTDTTVKAVEEILGRKVLTYHSQILFDPERAIEIFVWTRRPTDRGAAPDASADRDAAATSPAATPQTGTQKATRPRCRRGEGRDYRPSGRENPAWGGAVARSG
jgi:hypothetical protein